ncbi:MAG: P-II family nitrogen regulator [Oscillospiraceae bacterium]|nr:P-II family nitrogen regulator [Oscillospiraceae bacterium]
MDKKYQLIMCIINAGFSQTVMDAARGAGATGGTLLRARGTASQEAEEFFHITIQPDKEVVMILVPEEIKDKVLTAIYKEAGLAAAGHGIAFSLPVDATAGLHGPVKLPEGPKTS